MRGGFLSARVVVYAEAMNMVEAIGNVVRHGEAAHVYRIREG
jgi:CRISPR/Cas system-associated protein Cas7 (RAMP superfamily)